ncbi:MAG: molecular chaperone DnaJ, partial [Candidatus Omnitrophica bacterium]|nr:molecular chaperone DnaJ [Candidatus Omnitrophota bacterium]
AEGRFKEATEAYETLSDPRKRTTYDQFGHTMGAGAGGGGFDASSFSGFGDVFGDFFGDIFGGSTRGRPGPEHGASLETTLEIEFRDAAFGTEKKVEVPRYENCGTCSGSGAKPGTGRTTCNTCGGNGQVKVSSGFFQMYRTCERCGGEGSTIKSPCLKCSGRGRIKVARSITVKVPAGVETGTRLRITGEGEAGYRGGNRGDFFVLIVVKSHTIFNRHGDDVLCEVPITFPQAVLGSEIDVPTLDGNVKMKVPPGTQSGRIFRLRGKGVSHLRGSGRGDEHVRVVVETPTRLNRVQKRLMQEFAESCDDDATPMKKSFMDKVKKMFQ